MRVVVVVVVVVVVIYLMRLAWEAAPQETGTRERLNCGPFLFSSIFIFFSSFVRDTRSSKLAIGSGVGRARRQIFDLIPELLQVTFIKG